jgi:hypothetical protein
MAQRTYKMMISGNTALLLVLASAAVIAQTNGMLELPESYRTPLSDMVYDEQDSWRAAPAEDNPWREGTEPMIQPRLRTEIFPEYDYDTVEDSTQRSLFQNEYELERPRTNIFRYTF